MVFGIGMLKNKSVANRRLSKWYCIVDQNVVVTFSFYNSIMFDEISCTREIQDPRSVPLLCFTDWFICSMLNFFSDHWPFEDDLHSSPHNSIMLPVIIVTGFLPVTFPYQCLLDSHTSILIISNAAPANRCVRSFSQALDPVFTFMDFFVFL